MIGKDDQDRVAPRPATSHVLLTFPAQPESVCLLRAEARRAAAAHGADDALQQRIALAVSEAANNAIVHAYRDAPAPGEVRLDVRSEAARTLRIAVSDDGDGMRPRPDSPGAGLGLPMMAQLVDGFEVLIDRGTTVVMRFVLGA